MLCHGVAMRVNVPVLHFQQGIECCYRFFLRELLSRGIFCRVHPARFSSSLLATVFSSAYTLRAISCRFAIPPRLASMHVSAIRRTPRGTAGFT